MHLLSPAKRWDTSCLTVEPSMERKGPNSVIGRAGSGRPDESLANLLRAQPPMETLGGEAQPQQAADGG